MTEAQFDQLVDYTIQQLENGNSGEAIEQAFVKAGYPNDIIDAVFEVVEAELQPSQPSKFEQALQAHDEQSSQFFGGVLYWLRHVKPFRGRLQRGSFLLAFVYLIIVSVAVGFMLQYFADPNNVAELITSPLAWVVILSVGIIQNILFYSIVIRRFHDFGASGRWSLLILIPIVNLGVILYLMLKRGQDELNEYGGREDAIDPVTLLGLRLYTTQEQISL